VRRVGIIGGAGFIGSHFADHLLSDPDTEHLVIYDNFSSGRDWHLEPHRADARLQVVRGDVRDLPALTVALDNVDMVIHLASNPDIARAATEPGVDFDQGTLLTHCVLEAMRVAGPRLIVYASGSGVYGDLGDLEVDEDYGPLLPISTYGASKLAGEALISAYCAMFDFVGLAFRFGNVVGARQTHGVGFDFVRRLLANPAELRILGDGRQSKSYIAVADVVEAVMVAIREAPRPYAVFNVATRDSLTVQEIAALAVEAVGSISPTRLLFTGGDRGWRGDVPIVRLDTNRIRALGWANRLSSAEALRQSLEAMLEDARAGKFASEVLS
jgi:UDP-glucose 4-epimerase